MIGSLASPPAFRNLVAIYFLIADVTTGGRRRVINQQVFIIYFFSDFGPLTGRLDHIVHSGPLKKIKQKREFYMCIDCLNNVPVHGLSEEGM